MTPSSFVPLDRANGEAAVCSHRGRAAYHHWRRTSSNNAGADPNRGGPDGITPLEDACLKGSYSVAQMLLDNGASLNATNRISGETALYVAASFGNNDVVQLLLQRGADPNICGHKNRTTAYQTAVLNGYTDIARQIQQRGGSANCLTTPNSAPTSSPK